MEKKETVLQEIRSVPAIVKKHFALFFFASLLLLVCYVIYTPNKSDLMFDRGYMAGKESIRHDIKRIEKELKMLKFELNSISN